MMEANGVRFKVHIFSYQLDEHQVYYNNTEYPQNKQVFYEFISS